ncbi:MAG: amidophosphoribosyltransferase [Ruminococcaceae bacterium]|nr:amidophosphoribosyltransferase [Oscillospiraceae bacterium]
MGGFFGLSSKRDAVTDVFFGTDYHSHLGTRRAGMASWDKEDGFTRDIHNIENSPFRTKFDNVLTEMKGTSCIGVISDTDPQPQLVRSSLGTYAIATVGRINNVEEIIEEYFHKRGGYHFDSLSGGKVTTTELVSALIDIKEDFVEGIKFAQEVIDGTALILILKGNGNIVAARDKCGRLPLAVGHDEEGYCAAFETYSFTKLGYTKVRDLAPGEIVELSPEKMTVLAEGHKCKKMCSFLWAYFGYPASSYDGINVEVMRVKNGEIMADNDIKAGQISLDSVSGVPDSGTPHAIGYANESKLPFTRPFIKYTPTWPRSFMPSSQAQRARIAKMKQIPVHEFIEDKKMLLVDDSIVRGNQLQETVEFLYENGANEVHMRSACPPVMYACKFLNFARASSEYDYIARKIIYELEGKEGEKYINEYSDPKTERGKKLRQRICDKFGFASLEYQTLEGIVKAIGLDEENLCTYCFTGKE